MAAKGIAYGLQDILYLTEIDASTENNVDNESHVEDCTINPNTKF